MRLTTVMELERPYSQRNLPAVTYIRRVWASQIDVSDPATHTDKVQEQIMLWHTRSLHGRESGIISLCRYPQNIKPQIARQGSHKYNKFKSKIRWYFLINIHYMMFITWVGLQSLVFRMPRSDTHIWGLRRIIDITPFSRFNIKHPIMILVVKFYLLWSRLCTWNTATVRSLTCKRRK